MTKPKTPTAPTLADLRDEIDRIDQGMHQLLIERGQIIDTLIKVKKTQGFRLRVPARPRGLDDAPAGRAPSWHFAARHGGEHLARHHLDLHACAGALFGPCRYERRDAAMRDSVRFHFGFTVPFRTHLGAEGVVKAVAASKGDLGLVPANAVAGSGAWWTLLEGDKAPKMIARLPFVERADHPASLPVFGISWPAADAIVKEVEVFSVKVSGWSAAAARAVSPLAEVVAVPDSAFDGAALLISIPEGKTLADITAALVNAGASVRSSALVGSHATRYTIAGGARPLPAAR